MDLILKFQLDKRTVRHGLNVAAFATEMASQLALRGKGEGNLDDYFGDLSDADLIAELEETTDASDTGDPDEAAETGDEVDPSSPSTSDRMRMKLFKR